MKEETRRLLQKAERALRAAETLARSGDAEFSSGRAYYAMLYTAQALLREMDLRYRKHSSIHAAFGKHFAKPELMDRKFHRWLLDAFDERLRGDYDTEVDIEPESAALWIERAREFILAARRYLEEQG
ncbi:MAG TPA: HEPN domain-containing protein [Planctomycetes bacterium]|nr:HEPN domain-containing protein [Planctomycetota bacterium]